MSKYDKNEILKVTDGGRLIYEWIFPNLIRKDNKFEPICNTYRGEKNPSLSIYKYQNSDRWRHKDHGDSFYSGDCFDLIRQIRDVNFHEALNIIFNESGIKELDELKTNKSRMRRKENADDNTSQVSTEPKNRREEDKGTLKSLLLKNQLDDPTIKVKLKKNLIIRENIYQIKPHEQKYLDQYKIDVALFKLLGVIFIDGYHGEGTNGKKYFHYRSDNEILMAFIFDGYSKIYCPFPKKFRFIGNKHGDYFFGIHRSTYEKIAYEDQQQYGETIFANPDIFILAAGEKDALVALSLGYPSGCLNSETSVSSIIIEQLKKTHRYVCCLYDNDKTGLDQAKYLEEEHGIIPIYLPDALKEQGGKDISDYVKMGFDIGELHKLISNSIEKYLSVSSISSISYSLANHETKDNLENKLQFVDSSQNQKSDHFSTEIYSKLPYVIANCLTNQNDRTKDLYILSILTVISGCLKRLKTVYDKEEYFPHLYCIIAAPAGSGKGVVNKARKIGEHIESRQKRLYHHNMEFYKHNCSDRPAKMKVVDKDSLRYKLKKDISIRQREPKQPLYQNIFLPANSSSAAFYLQMNRNSGNGIIFENEADTIVEAFNKDWGNFSDGKRKAFQHEPISVLRKDKDESFTIDKPRLAFMLTGTPNQIVSMIKDTENGLFSRYIYYVFSDDNDFKNPFDFKDYTHVNSAFNELAETILSYYIDQNLRMNDVYFSFTENQQLEFTKYFIDKEKQLVEIFKDEIKGSTRRMGLIFTRIAMILQYLYEGEKNNFPDKIYCSNLTFDITMSIVDTLFLHTKRAFELIESKQFELKLSLVQQQILDSLPDEFTWSLYEQVAKDNGINAKGTYEKYIRKYLREGFIKRVKQGEYLKL